MVEWKGLERGERAANAGCNTTLLLLKWRGLDNTSAVFATFRLC
jgi:hypothetical protein